MFAKARLAYSNGGYNLPALIAFLLPFGINYAPIFIVWTVCYLFLGDPINGFKKVFRYFWSYILLGFFFLHVAGYWFSDNKHEALVSIEGKMSFFAFALLLFCIDYEPMKVKKIMTAFVTGCFLTVAFCLFRAFGVYFFDHINAFFYSDFSYFLHPSYFAMYLVLAQLIVMLFYKDWLPHIKNLDYKIGLTTVLNVTGIFLCSSKMGLISALVLLPATFAVILFKRGYKKTIAGLILSLVIGMVVAYKLFPSPFERIKVAFTVTASAEHIDKTASESTAVRILIWEQAVKIIKQHLVLGITPGDTNDALYKAYEENGLTGALAKKLNAHNQYLQTFIGTGLIGFSLLCLMTVGCIIIGFIKKNYILALFSILIILNFLVESMLQTQAGIVFFVLFLCLFLQYDLSTMKENNETEETVNP
jgi:hypothetical protein